jgi:integrase
MNKSEFHSIMAPFFHDYILLKNNLGYKYTAAKSILKNLDKFLYEKDIKEPTITKELCEEWMVRRPHEAGKTYNDRVGALIGFARYMGDIGRPCFIPRSSKAKERGFVAHIFTEDELSRFFYTCDNLTPASLRRNSIIIFLPALFRLLYGTGVRITEALLLKDRDVHLDENYLLLRDTKSRKDKIVPISQSLSDVCKEYRKYREMLPVKIDTEYFFLSLSGRACMKQGIIYRWFRIILQEAGIPHRGKHLGPRVHDFRHTFSVHSLVKMNEQGYDMYCSLPVLSTYLGHSSIAATNNYVRLCESMYPELVRKMGVESLNVYPKLFEDETN